jgi:hypothetical protein
VIIEKNRYGKVFIMLPLLFNMDAESPEMVAAGGY